MEILDLVKITSNVQEIKDLMKHSWNDDIEKLMIRLVGKIGKIIDKNNNLGLCVIRFYSGESYVLPENALKYVSNDSWKEYIDKFPASEEKGQEKTESKEFIGSHIPSTIWPIPLLQLDQNMDTQIKKYFPKSQEKMMIFRADNIYDAAKYIIFKCVQLLEEKKNIIINYLKLLLPNNVNDYLEDDKKYYTLFHSLYRIEFSSKDDLGTSYGETCVENNHIIIKLREDLLDNIEDIKKNAWGRMDIYNQIYVGSIILFHEIFHYLTKLILGNEANTPSSAKYEAGYYGEFHSFGGLICYKRNKKDYRIENVYFWECKGNFDHTIDSLQHENDFLHMTECKIVDPLFGIKYYYDYHGQSDFWNNFNNYTRDTIVYETTISAKPRGEKIGFNSYGCGTHKLKK